MSSQALAQVAETQARVSVHEAFDFADSDVTLRSSDGVLFRVHKSHLAAQSVFFRSMFDCGTETAPEIASGVPVAETAATLGVLLPMCYPAAATGAPPVDLEALDHKQLLSCYQASCKYDMWVASQLLRRVLLPHVGKDPFKIVRIAYTVEDRDMLTRAAAATLSLNILGKVNEYREKAGVTWSALLEYHMRSKAEVQEFMRVDLAGNFGSHYSPRKVPRPDHDGDCVRNSGVAARHARDLEWEIFRWSLANRTSVELPKVKLLEFIERMLDRKDVGICEGCRSSWLLLRKSVNDFQPKCVFNL